MRDTNKKEKEISLKLPPSSSPDDRRRRRRRSFCRESGENVFSFIFLRGAFVMRTKRRERCFSRLSSQSQLYVNEKRRSNEKHDARERKEKKKSTKKKEGKKFKRKREREKQRRTSRSPHKRTRARAKSYIFESNLRRGRTGRREKEGTSDSDGSRRGGFFFRSARASF